MTPNDVQGALYGGGPGWAVCSYRGVLMQVFETYREAHDWVGQQLSTSDYYIRPATNDDKRT